jgi:flagellar basal-body rod modification protein FlgD
MTTAVNNTTGTNAPTAAANAGRARLAENFDTFLTLLTAQMKNQDPLSPMDSTQFTQQLVQMTGVEQQLETNDLLKELVAKGDNDVSSAVSLIGWQVRAESDQAGLANGKATWTYNLSRAATETKLEVMDAEGRIVRTISGARTAGDNTFTWDGKDQSGLGAAPGVYTLRVTAKDSSGTSVSSKTYVDGIVNSVEQTGGNTLVAINGAKIPWGKVSHVKMPTTPTDGSTSSTPAA